MLRDLVIIYMWLTVLWAVVCYFGDMCLFGLYIVVDLCVGFVFCISGVVMWVLALIVDCLLVVCWCLYGIGLLCCCLILLFVIWV